MSPVSTWLEARVKRINLNDMYELGKSLAPLEQFLGDDTIKSRAFELFMANLRLIGATHGQVLPNASIRAAQGVLKQISNIIGESPDGAFADYGDKKLEWGATSLKNALRTFESVLSNDLPEVASYVVTQKGIFRTDDLIAHAENHLPDKSKALLPEVACNDLREAGKCLAYELPTACAFHLWRAIETVMGDYYFKLTAQTLEAAGVTRNWGAYIIAMNKAGADKKITAFLDHIREKYRNPQMHPNEVVELEEARGLFSVATSSIDQMLMETSKLPGATPPAASPGGKP